MHIQNARKKNNKEHVPNCYPAPNISSMDTTKEGSGYNVEYGQLNHMYFSNERNHTSTGSDEIQINPIYDVSSSFMQRNNNVNENENDADSISNRIEYMSDDGNIYCLPSDSTSLPSKVY